MDRVLLRARLAISRRPQRDSPKPHHCLTCTIRMEITRTPLIRLTLISLLGPLIKMFLISKIVFDRNIIVSN
jgi:hypothetical protein